MLPINGRRNTLFVYYYTSDTNANRYLYGGYGFGTPAAFNDVYILSLPSYKWVKGYPLGGSNSETNVHGGCSANVMNPDQMMIIGGWFPNPEFGCDTPETQGQHNMILGNNTDKQENGLWDKYDSQLTTYAVPTLVISAIGGGCVFS
jgi:hypothetical protein